MMRRTMTMLGLAGIVLTACNRRSGADDAADTEAPVASASRLQNVDGAAMVVLDSSDERRLDLAVTTLTSRTTSPAVILTGEVVADSSRTSVVRAPIAGRLFQPEGTRWPAFGETVRAGQVLAQVSDARPLAAAVGGVVTRVAARPGELVDAGQALLEVTDFSSPLVRVAWSADAPPTPPARITVTGIDRTGAQVEARLEGPALEADPLTRLPAWLYRAARPWPGARPGLPVSAAVAMPGASGRGAFVPQAAVVQWDGLIWVFRRRGTGQYERVRVPSAHAVAGGWLVPDGDELSPGDTVVVRGAQVLLSEEFKSRVRVGDEVAE
ncbi:MAG: HlyD family efflux transporter periplasmic adaptor subunit [Gemmatimonadales bacterium]